MFSKKTLLLSVLISSSGFAQLPDFNALQSVLGNQPQFSVEPVQNGEVIHANNGGIGDGIAATSAPTISGQALSPSSFFCSTKDEENEFSNRTGHWANIGLDALGSYHFFRFRDRWREQRESSSFYLGVPLVAINCTRGGQTRVVNFNQWRNFSTTSVNGNNSALRTVVTDGFRNRNYVEDPYNFRYGLYLFKFMPRDSFNANTFGQRANPSPTLSDNEVYQPNFYEPNSFACPYGREQQRWGFLCGEMATAGAYTDLNLPDSPARASSALMPNTVIDRSRWNLYKTLLGQVVHLLGVKIDHGDFGNSTDSSRTTVTTIWEILKTMNERVPTAPFGTLQRAAASLRGSSNIEGYLGNTPEDVPVALDRSDTNAPKLALRKDLGMDLQSKRTLSHAHYNSTVDPSEGGYSSVSASYDDLIDGGLYKNLFTPNRGYQWVVNPTTHEMRANPVDGKVGSNGYGGDIVSSICHQLCHLHYREQGIAFSWGTPQASAEENLCVTAQSICYDTLNQLNHIRSAIGISAEEYNPDSNPNTVGAGDGFIGKRFYYRDELRAKDQIIVAPLHEDMMMIAGNLKRRSHEMARMGANLVSMCPFFQEPEYSCLSGSCGHNPYYVAPAAPTTQQQQQQFQTYNPGAAENNPQGQVQEGMGGMQQTIENMRNRQGGSSKNSNPLNINGQGQTAPKPPATRPAGGEPAGQPSGEQPKPPAKTSPSGSGLSLPGAPAGKNQGTGK